MPYRIAQIEAKFKFYAGYLNLKISVAQVPWMDLRDGIFDDEMKELA
jgi:hypothetical protein